MQSRTSSVVSRGAVAALAVLSCAAVAMGPALPAGAQTTRPPATTTPRTLTTPVFSPRRVPELLRAKQADDELERSAKAVFEGAPATACAVVSEMGREIVSINADTALMPASTNKLLTATSALEHLGPDTRLRTSARALAKPAGDGTIAGDLYLVGGGDPLLFTQGFRVTLKDQNQAGTDFPALADNIRSAGVSRITGNIVGDDSRHDSVRDVPSWPDTYQKQDAVGALSALEVNRGISGLSKAPDQPATKRLIGDPPVLGAETLKSLLEARGVQVTGQAVAGVAPPSAVEVAFLDSLPVKDIVAEMLTWSDNTTAEVLTKEVGLKVAKSGSTAAGTTATQQTLRELGVPLPGIALTDGSGLDRNNQVACSTLEGLLDHEGPDSDLARGLSIAGKTGTLRPRFRGTPAEGNLVAKTGTLNDVSALAGFLTTPQGAVLTFAVIVNGQLPPKTSATKYEDDLVTALLTYPQGPPLEPLLPKPPR